MMETVLVYLKCFLVGGLLCAVGQVLIDKTALTPARWRSTTPGDWSSRPPPGARRSAGARSPSAGTFEQRQTRARCKMRFHPRHSEP